MRRLLWMLLAALACVSGEYLMGGHLDNNARSKTPRKTHLDNLDLVAEESTVAAVAIADDGAKSAILSDEEGDAPRYHVPYSFAFNGGKPFSLEKDPITGKIDFEKTPLVKPLNYTDGLHEDNEKDGDSEDAEEEETKSKDHEDVRRNEITQSHYFLPTHYSSDKYQYPLISSSYANTKVQSGGNSYNHRLDAENDVLYARPSKNPYLLPTKTSTHKTTTAGDYKARWTSPPTITTTTAPSTTAANSQTTFFTKTPNITTWKPSSTPTAFHTAAEMENEKNLLPIEKLHASGQAGPQRNPSNSAPTRSPNDAGTTTQKAQSNPEHNLVGSHARPETKPPAQNDEYNLYDIYDLSGSESEEEDAGHDNKEMDYLLPFQELLRENATSTSSATIISSRPATSATTTTASAATTTVASSTGSATSTTITAAPQSPPRSSTPPPAPQENVFASIRPLHISTIPQYPVATPNNDRRPSLTDHHDSVISHVYRPGPMIKPDQNRIESTSNIVIPPDQNTVSFVLGNRQNVEGSYHSVGTAVGENLFGTSADISFWPLRNDQQHGPANEVKYEHPPVPSVTQKWPASGAALKGGNELDPTRSQNSGIVPLETTQGNKDSDYVSFPDDETNSKGTEVIVNEADGSIPITTVNDTKLAFGSISENLPQLAQDLMPPAKSTRPPQYYYHYQYDTSHPDHLRPQRLPPPPRVKPHPGVLPLDPRKRPYSPDTKLPNILPQFRPNAKTSHGHRGPDAIGTMPAGQGPPARIRQPLPGHSPPRRPFPLPPPSYLQRLNPPPPPIHAVRLPFVPTSKVEGVALPHEAEPTIRRFVSPVRPPHAGAPPPVISHGNPEENALSNRLFGHGAEERNSGTGEAGENRKEDRLKSELEHAERYPEHENAERYPEEPPMTPPRPPLFPKRRTADPPRVTTLQMLQQHGELNDEEREEAPQEAALAHEMERRKSDDHDPPEVAPAEQPVYVVYPVNTAVNIDPDDSGEKDGSVVVGTRGPQRPLPPDTLLQDEREETHAVYHGKPVAADFPYLLERPDPSSVLSAVGVKESPVLVPSDQWQQASATAAASEQERNEQDAVNVIPYLQDQFLPYRKKSDAAISVTLHRAPPTAISTSSAPTSTPTPIAYVYTPTQAAHRPDYVDVEDDAAVDAKQMVLLPSQQPSSSSSSAPAPQNFMAPFVASMSAEAPSKNGWNVVVVNPSAGTEKKSDSDVDGDGDANPEAEYTQTEKNEFDADNFKPQLFGGFKPIYQFPKEDAEQDDVVEQADTELNMPRHSKELPAVPDGR